MVLWEVKGRFWGEKGKRIAGRVRGKLQKGWKRAEKL